MAPPPTVAEKPRFLVGPQQRRRTFDPADGPVSQTEVSSYARVNIDPLRRLLQDRLVTDV